MSVFKPADHQDCIYGYKIIEEPHMTECALDVVARTWRERLLSWTPFKATKEVVVLVPSSQIVEDKERKILVMHPDMKAELMRAIDGRSNQ